MAPQKFTERKNFTKDIVRNVYHAPLRSVINVLINSNEYFFICEGSWYKADPVFLIRQSTFDRVMAFNVNRSLTGSLL